MLKVPWNDWASNTSLWIKPPCKSFMSLRISLRKEYFPRYPASFTLQSKPILFEGKKLFQFVFYFALLGMSTTKWIWRDSFTVHCNAQYDLMSFLGYKIVKYDTIQYNTIQQHFLTSDQYYETSRVWNNPLMKKKKALISPVLPTLIKVVLPSCLTQVLEGFQLKCWSSVYKKAKV